MDIRGKYIERLKQLCGLFEITWDVDPEIFEPSDIEKYKNAVEELRFLTGRNQVNNYFNVVFQILCFLQHSIRILQIEQRWCRSFLPK